MDRQAAALTEMTRAVNAGDAAAYARVYAEDAIITIHGSRPLQGRRAIEAYEVDLLREFPGARLGFHTAWQDGPRAVVHYAVNGRTPGGAAMGHEGLLFYRFAPTGLIVEERRYLDSFTPMAQLGALGPGPSRALPSVPGAMKSEVATGSTAEKKNEAVARAAMAAWDARDESRLLGLMADGVVVDEMIETRPYAGREGARSWLQAWARAAPDAHTEIASALAAGDTVVLETILRGTLEGPLGRLTVPAAQAPFAVHRAAVVTVKDGRIVRLLAFMNSKELAEAAGQWPPRPAP